MKFEDWEPYYIQILDHFGFSRVEDEKAALLLADLAARDDLSLLRGCCRGNHVTVCGNAPCLKDELDQIKGIVFAADAAADRLFSWGILPDAIFTDLDGAKKSFIEMNLRGTILVVHAHGDNVPLLNNWVPRFQGPFVATTQASPLPNVHNFGGFSDGDRAVFAADALGAKSIGIVGFDLDDLDVSPVKKGKLIWARKLLKILGYDL
jgi:uncharacterized Rossmann fold enzyme